MAIRLVSSWAASCDLDLTGWPMRDSPQRAARKCHFWRPCQKLYKTPKFNWPNSSATQLTLPDVASIVTSRQRWPTANA